MQPLKEIHAVRQVKGEPRRRWFSSDTQDLVVWYDDTDAICGFQLCYDLLHRERAITWCAESDALMHAAVDDGEASTRMGHKSTPILVPDGVFNADNVLRDFLVAATEIPADITALIQQKLGRPIA